MTATLWRKCRETSGYIIQEALLVDSITEWWAHTTLEFPNVIEVGGGHYEQSTLVETFSQLVGMGNITFHRASVWLMPG